MAEQSDGNRQSKEWMDDDEMFWEEVRKKQVRRQRSYDSGSCESVETVKRSKPMPEKDPVWKVIVFEQQGGPDLHPIHVTKAIAQELGQINHARFLGNGRLLIFAISEDQRNEILKKTSLNGCKITSHVPGTTAKLTAKEELLQGSQSQYPLRKLRII